MNAFYSDQLYLCFDVNLDGSVGVPEDQPWDASYWRGKKVDTYGYGPPTPPLLDFPVHTGYGQGQGQSLMESPFATGDYTFEFAIPLRGDRYGDIPIDLDNRPGDLKSMKMIMKYLDARIYKDFPEGEINPADLKFQSYRP